MTFLAYDPDLLTALRRQMALATDELRAVRCDDVEATHALAAVRRCVADYEFHWLPVLTRILTDAPLDRDIPLGHDLDALDSALARSMAVARGWAVAADPTADDHVTMADAVALADRLSVLDLTALAADPDALAWLTQRWRMIALSPALAATFVEHFPTWSSFADAISRHRALLAGHEEPAARLTLAGVDDALDSLGAVLRHAGATRLDDVAPYTAALLLRSLGLDAAELARAADHILLRPRDAFDDLPGETRADVVLHGLLRDPAACTHYLDLAMDHPATLFDHVTDPSLADRVVLTATDPRVVDDTTAGRLVPRVIRWFDSEPTRDPGVLLADLVAPWTVQLSPTHHGWGLQPAERNALLACALRGDGALERFIDDEAHVIAGARRSISRHEAHLGELLSGWVGLIGELVMNERVRLVALRRKSWDMLCNIASVAVSMLPGAAVGVAATLAVVVVHDHLGPDVAKANHTAVWGRDAAITKVASYLAEDMHRTWVHEGLLSDQFPGPPTFDPTAQSPSETWYNALEDWMDILPGGMNGRMSFELRSAVWVVLNPGMVGEHSGQVGT